MIVRIHGGLANQMFQYAFGESVSAVRKEEVFYHREGPDRLFPFNIRPIEYRPESAPLFGDICQYDPRVYSAPNGTSFVGCWQSEKFFDADKVRLELSFRVEMSDESKRVADDIMKVDSASAFLHVRRGDYVFANNQKFHGMPTMRYYNEVVERIRARYEGAHFWVFSDDPEWCSANFPSNFTVVGHNKIVSRDIPGQEHEDIWLMSLCHHGAIANSSFSWWGAWFGTQADKLVFAPKQWFVASVESKDICPDRWTKLDN